MVRSSTWPVLYGYQEQQDMSMLTEQRDVGYLKTADSTDSTASSSSARWAEKCFKAAPEDISTSSSTITSGRVQEYG